MLPRYDEGDVVVCFREQRRALQSFYGEEAAVRVKDGHRYLKIIEPGPRQKTVNLLSFNANVIRSVQLEWIGEIYATVRAGQIRRIEQRERKSRRMGLQAET